MANTTLTANVIAKEALTIVENNLGVMKTFHRVYEDEWGSTVNGYKKGESIDIRRPADFTVRSGVNMSTQDVIEGKVNLSIDQMVGIDFKFTSQQLTLSIGELGERVIKPAMSRLINHVASDCLTVMAQQSYEWAGTPGQLINSFADFGKGPERLDEMAVPEDDRYAVLSPADHWALLGSQTNLYIQGAANDAYRNAKLGEIGGVKTMMSQVVPTITLGTADNTTPLVRGATQNVTYDAAKNTWSQTLNTDGWDASSTLKAGQVFTIANVFKVNPKTKANTGIPQQFTITTDVTADGTTSNNTPIVVTPPIITSGPHQTVNAAPADDAVITLLGTASTGYRANMVYHKNAFAFASVPLEMPAAAYGGHRESYKGLSVRVIPVYNGSNDESSWRLDFLYGRKLIDPRLITKLSGTAS